MFVCFHAGGLRGHVYLTRVLLSAGSPLCFSVTLTTSPRSLPHCPASPPPASLLFPSRDNASHSAFPLFLPSPSCSLGTASAGLLEVPHFRFQLHEVDFQAESRQQDRAELLRLLVLLMTALGCRGAVFRDCAPCRKQRPEPVSESGVSQAWRGICHGGGDGSYSESLLLYTHLQSQAQSQAFTFPRLVSCHMQTPTLVTITLCLRSPRKRISNSQ